MAQKDKTTLVADINAALTTNGNGDITAALHRVILFDLIDSIPNLIDDPALTGLRAYDGSKSYATGDHVTEAGKLYKANKGTTGAFAPADWDEISDGGISGLTIDTIPVATAANAIGDSIIQQNAAATRIGIGVAPLAQLHISGIGSQFSRLEATASGSFTEFSCWNDLGTGNRLLFSNNGSTAGGTPFGISGNNLGLIQKSGVGANLVVGTGGTGFLILGTNGVERIRISGTGEVIIADLAASQIVETDGSVQLISVAKGTAYNKAFPTAGSAGTSPENEGNNTTPSRSDHEHAIPFSIQMSLAGNISNGDKVTFRIPVPYAGVTWQSMYVRLKTAAGTSLDINVERFNEAGASQGNMWTAALALGTAEFGVKTATFDTGEATPTQNDYYDFVLTNIAGSPPKDIVVQLRGWIKSDVKPV